MDHRELLWRYLMFFAGVVCSALGIALIPGGHGNVGGVQSGLCADLCVSGCVPGVLYLYLS